ncbi:nucleotidyl transferase AbiEii/AbiGii toxin family protein [Xenorhabdus nematophila]|uniref:Nucleotidyl transferase AbiEii/AbiGii toxin family protein n=1 Tax=Xenorhabdus nematophila (strain ATCC 19061 / DSM 3370 / CCUG 14189 / LMG 1036 / NCIMB 9965 / AN6) TaxID=406817 RepID=D3VF99_XENNA|nr:nucleotidyl transferase AbiEii/AbiGii toxin family protein [Xenorhabdus nematophila]MBA0020492.1 nucleotidyl transferase AbiEii/AbiGii toxin family protein [Xenorhabdus nematophila]MCB4427112.1 hypothetical protein [Xenorhabdus nematophila]QNJ36135.1 nucleotidyl transferase AbiEii/AbiGii toxin family protein [Xenorhabdus nematophila]CBJ92556.1 hypothetical protein XNC1_4534 [Xenorhabdus nematophila ATCC 19061]CEK25367.1 hypothetical protein XNC2_4380 [Xenorhabdus nematophila AN6/1]
MKLHKKENISILAEAVRLTAAEFNLPQSYVEKDYFITKALLELSKFRYSSNVVFKGGTSLSKVYKSIYRFSEDVDLAILPEDDWTNNKIKKVIKAAIQSASVGLEDSGIPFRNGSRFRKERYNFPRMNWGVIHLSWISRLYGVRLNRLILIRCINTNRSCIILT